MADSDWGLFHKAFFRKSSGSCLAISSHFLILFIWSLILQLMRMMPDLWKASFSCEDVYGSELFVCPQNDAFYHVSDLLFLKTIAVFHHLYLKKVVLCNTVPLGLASFFFWKLLCTPVFINNISTCAYDYNLCECMGLMQTHRHKGYKLIWSPLYLPHKFLIFYSAYSIK